MAVSSFTQFDNNQKKTIGSNLFQVIDVIQSDISGSGNRRKYESFLSSSGQTELTSSLYQTVYDQEFTLQTANPVLDMAVGLFHCDKTNEGGIKRTNLVTQAVDYNLNANGQPTFNPTSTVMMREKINIYRQYANLLLGDADACFGLGDNASVSLTNANVNTDLVFDACYFINVKRLFSRDGIRPETFALRLYENMDSTVVYPDSNIDVPGEGAYIIADIGGNSSTVTTAQGYKYSWLVKAAAVEEVVGIIFYEPGIVVLNLGQGATGAASASSYGNLSAHEAINPSNPLDGQLALATMDSQGNNTKVYPDLYVQGSVDDIVDHIASTRFGSGQLTAMAFQNQTNIQSSIYICRSHISNYNVSNNPTWLPSMTSIAPGDTNNWFTYITSVALLDDTGEIVAVAKLNRPVYKSQDAEVSIRIRLDF